jgi:3-phenylpropionate/trans-cinnamate dioxygenase ferredoxin reductase subunit
MGRLHRDHGVRLLTDRQIDTIEGVAQDMMVLLVDGTRIDCHLVVLGVTPSIHLAERAALSIVGGGVRRRGLRTSDPAIFVAGDIAAAHHPLTGFRSVPTV